MAGDGDLVFRQELLRRLLGSAAGAFWDVQGIPGAGKSVLLWEAAGQAAPDDVVTLIDMQDYFTAFEQQQTADGVGQDVGEELRRFGRALSAMVSRLRDVSPTASDSVEMMLNDIGKMVGDAADLESARAHERAEELVELVQLELNRLAAVRAEAGGKAYLLVDTFDLVAARPLGMWFLRLLAALKGSVVAVARRQEGAKAAALPGATQVMEVGGLTPEEVAEYLRRRLDNLGTGIAARVHGFTGGHALAVGLTADVVSDLRRRGQADTVDGPVEQLIVQMEAGRADQPNVRVERLMHRFTDSAEDYAPDVRLGLQCLLVVGRRFDASLLERLITAAGAVNGLQLTQRLIGYSFVERRTPPNRPADQYYVVHDSVRSWLERTLIKPKELIKEAEAYYEDKVSDTLDSYDRWFRYEDPRWQTNSREWLYYVSQLDPHSRSGARLSLAKLFLDGFWWWGNYISFPFCEELITDWAETVARGQAEGSIDRTWGRTLRELYVLYPKGWRRERGDWDAIQERVLYFLGNGAELPENTTDSRVRHIQAILKIYLADTERFLDPQSGEADEILREARHLFDDDEDDWNVAWMSYQQADTALGRVDLEGAIAAAEEGWSDWQDLTDKDFELLANLHRIHADAAWARGEHGLALDFYARAALCAYQFQIDVGDPNTPPIDEYTQAFMIEMHERAAERLLEMHRAGEDSLGWEACARIREFFDHYRRAVSQPASARPTELPGDADGAELLVGYLMPPAPESADLHRQGTAYMQTAAKVLYRMRRELLKPPGSPLPPVAS